MSTPAATSDQPLLRVRHLSKRFPVKLGLFKKGAVSAVDAVSFDVATGETLGIVGESGCGKSTTASLVLRLIEPDEGKVLFEGADTRQMVGPAQKAFRRGMQMVFQDPYSSVNPRMSIGENIGYPLKIHGFGRQEIRERTADLLEQVGLHLNHASYFPHQLSGGQLQRANIARALALQPRLVICDEPLSALDKSIQAQALNLLEDLQNQLQLTYIFVSHDLNVVEYFSDRILVMYLGQVVESCSSDELYRNPLHPYTKVLLGSIPKSDPDERRLPEPGQRRASRPSRPPERLPLPPRCAHAMEICAAERPALRITTADHAVACHLFETPGEVPTTPIGAAAPV